MPVYLLKLAVPLGTSGSNSARYYLGYAKCVQSRLDEHRKGNGSAMLHFLKVVMTAKAAGYTLVVNYGASHPYELRGEKGWLYFETLEAVEDALSGSQTHDLFSLVRVWKNGDRALERKLKRTKHLNRYDPTSHAFRPDSPYNRDYAHGDCFRLGHVERRLLTEKPLVLKLKP